MNPLKMTEEQAERLDRWRKMGVAERQIGRTTGQIIHAPKNAIYVWPVATSIGYAKRLAQAHGRNDLEIISEGQFRLSLVAGRRDIDCVIDHATKLSREGVIALNYIADRVLARLKKEDKL